MASPAETGRDIKPDIRLDVDLTKSQGRFRVALRCRMEARITGIFGPTGAGKTTLLHMIAGLVRPDAGRIALGPRLFFDSKARVNLPPEERGAGLVFQDNRLFPHLSVRDNLLFGAGGKERPERAPNDAGTERENEAFAFEAIVEALELESFLDRRPDDLSGGERKRTALGRALLRRPQLLLLDEPFAALDARRRVRTLEFLQRYLAERALPTLLISHDPRDIRDLAGAILVMEEGALVHQGASEDYFFDQDGHL